MQMMRAGWIGLFLVSFSIFSVAMADDSVKAPGVQINADGSVVAPGVKVSPDGSVSAPGVDINTADHNAAAKGPDGNYAIENDSQTIDLECNGEIIAVNGNNNTLRCHGESAMLVVNGNGNTIHFKGTCDQLNMNGAENKAEIERIGSINAQGDNNNITWASASTGPNPNIVSLGQNNVIKMAK